MNTSRTDFNATWLSEMPAGLGSFETFDALEYHIRDLIKNGKKPQQVKDDLFKIDMDNSVYYWYSSDDQIVLGAGLDKKPQALVINLTGKNPQYRNRAPYASDLYHAILRDTSANIRVVSDTQMSDSGYAIWKNLLQRGHTISVYDRENPGKSFKTLNSVAEMDQFFRDDDTDYARYQFVLSEKNAIAECRSFFHTRRYRELSGLLLED